MSKGMVVIAGAGPGDPELITLKALKYVKMADVIVYDRLVPKEILKYSSDRAELIYVGKEPGRHTMSQDEINELLYSKAVAGKLVVRLKGGDPYVFGRGEEECLYLVRRGVPCRVVPGVPSFIAAAACSGVPLNSRGVASSFAVLTGTLAEGSKREIHIDRIAESVDTIVILMGARRALEILKEIARVRGPDELGAVVINASRKDQEVIVGRLLDLINVAKEGRIRNPAVIIVGKVVGLRDEGLWRSATS